ncbi:MAG: anaerobic sulfatase maturase [Kiritimatiellaeota bacterium]|nr:anaerobic sulfatase maturase [Kiritimatiellota bacterium]
MNFSLLIKPASYRCNLRCRYCFYLEKSSIYSKGVPSMTNETLERMISSFMAIPMRQHSFGWQGGEPTTMGLDFFKRVTELQKKHGRSGKVVSNGLQTNATLLDDEWCAHLAEYKFLVGVSLDGPKEIHDASRITIGGEGSYDMVVNGLKLLQQHKVEHNILTLVSSSNMNHPLKVYNHLKDSGFFFHQYIECVEFDENGILKDFSVTSGKWGEFLSAIFDEWYENDTRTVSVRLFDSILTMMVENHANVCAMNRDCRQYFLVEHNGDVYPCDFFMLPEWRLGNINNGEWADFAESALYAKFGGRKHHWNAKCADCEYSRYCAGCCPKNRPGHAADPTALSVLCDGWRLFFEHALPRFKLLASRILEERRAAQAGLERQSRRNRSNPPGKTGRNAPCPCGSGKKYKKCCGALSS